MKPAIAIGECMVELSLGGGGQADRGERGSGAEYGASTDRPAQGAEHR